MSKGLEAFRRLVGWFGLPTETTPRQLCYEDKELVEKELKEKEKKDKVLEIIKTKLLAGCFSEEDNYSNYAMAIVMSGNEMLKKNMMTEQEYNLVKEVLL